MTSSTSAPYTTAAYITLTATSAVTLSGAITASPSSGYQVAYYTSQGFWVTLPVSGTLSLTAGSAAYFAVYSPGTALPSPNPDGCVGVQPDATSRNGAHVALVGVQPINAGATFSYTGTLSETMFRSSPCPIPTTASSATVTIAVSMSPGPGSELNENSTETDAYSTETVSTSTDALVEASTYSGKASLDELQETTTDEVGDSTVTTYGTPLVYGITALPYSGTITNGPPSTVNATLADGSVSLRTYNSNGSYTECDTVAGIGGTCSNSTGGSGPVNTIVLNSDGSGTYLIQTPNFVPQVTSIQMAVSAPQSGNMTITETNNGSSPTPQSWTVPQFWQGSLYSDTTTASNPGALPPQCGSGSALSNLGGINEFSRTITTVDPVLGYTDTRVINSYVAENYQSLGAVGPVCVTINDTENIYIDYFLDTTYFIYPSFNGQPLQVDTIAEQYWFASAPTGDTSVRGLAASIAAHEAGIAFTRTIQRTQRLEQVSGGLK
jgi:hypothetical protein